MFDFPPMGPELIRLGPLGLFIYLLRCGAHIANVLVGHVIEAVNTLVPPPPTSGVIADACGNVTQVINTVSVGPLDLIPFSILGLSIAAVLATAWVAMGITLAKSVLLSIVSRGLL